MERCVARVPSLQVAGVYDFDYDLTAPREMDDDLIDCVLVLKKH